MFDMLTRDQLYALHTSLAASATRIHQRIMGLPVFSDAWQIASAAHDEITETMSAISSDLTRRNA